MKLEYLTILSICLRSFVMAGESSEEMYSVESSSEEEMENEAVLEEEPDFDLLIFTQRWPITSCYEWREQSASHICGLPSPKNIWTIHGIWPTKLNTIGPSFCDKSATFNVTALQSIEQQLEQFWINVEKNKPYDSLWRHEWLKHGTCAAAVLTQLNTENKYFGQGLSWLQQHSMADVLTEGGITPGGNYTVIGIHKVLIDRLQKDVAIECYHDSETKQQFLNEIRVCFSKELELTDCDGILFKDVAIDYSAGKIITNCYLNKSVMYPATVPMSRFDKTHMSPFDLHKKFLDEYNRKKSKDSKTMKLLVNIYKLIQLLKWTTI
ncbi:ribonuclease Oy [Toxorhynchites rutilus septentrionalis]|uniref:ribonuclease Oy n=1 Tax=Toxorhynchites rutilus septentrionalis TaxID=329112 RepID=UPI0024792B9E|nr:ribonuclease Oy [Toxorhynchites rutilus septentrionalis]